MSKKRLLMFHPALAPYRIDFFNSLASHFDTTFYFFNENVLNQNFNQKELREETHFKVNYLISGLNLPGRSIRFGIRKVIKEMRPDIIICPEYNMINLNIILISFFSRKKFHIYTICDDNITMAQNASLIRRILRATQLKILNGIILTNIQVADWYRTNLNPKAKILVFPIIRNDVQFLNRLKKCVPIASDYIEEYQLKNKKVLLFVGRLVEIKNLFRLIEALMLVREKSDSAVLIIIGSGSLEMPLKQKVKDLQLQDAVILPGRFEKEELFAWYLTAGVFILPSTSESFGAVINEALLAGCYVLSSEIAGASNLIEENVNGNLFNPYKTDELADLIISTIQKDELFKNQGELRDSRMLIGYNEIIESLLKQLD